MRQFEFKYPNGFIQQKILVSHDDYLKWRDMPEGTDDELLTKDSFWRSKTGGQEWFTDKSPFYDAIETGVINCNGAHPVKIRELLLIGFNQFLKSHETFQLAVIEVIHRYYYDKCFDEYSRKMFDTPEAKYFSDLLQTLSCEIPDWRYRLKKKLERYHGWGKTSALNVGCKPKRILHIMLNSEQEVKVSDTTGDDSKEEAGKKIKAPNVTPTVSTKTGKR